MVQVRQVLARVFVDSLDEALPLYQRLAETDDVRRFAFGEVELAWVGSFLLLCGPRGGVEAYRDRVASVIVDDVDQVAELITETGGELIDGPGAGPNGKRLIARHPDGAVFEYLQLNAPDH